MVLEEEADKSRSQVVYRHVGARIRVRRRELEMSQSVLGDAIGVTFQQVQKYEKGGTIGVERLIAIAQALQTPTGYFLEGMPPLTAGRPAVHAAGFAEAQQAFRNYPDAPDQAETAEMMEAFSRISDHRVRGQVIALMKVLQPDPG